MEFLKQWIPLEHVLSDAQRATKFVTISLSMAMQILYYCKEKNYPGVETGWFSFHLGIVQCYIRSIPGWLQVIKVMIQRSVEFTHRRFPSVSGATRYSDPDLPQLLPLPARPSSSYEPRPKVWQPSINWIYLDSWLQIMVMLQWFSHGNTKKHLKFTVALVDFENLAT